MLLTIQYLDNALIDNKQTKIGLLILEELIGLEYLLNELHSHLVPEIPRELSEQKRIFLYNLHVGVVEDL